MYDRYVVKYALHSDFLENAKSFEDYKLVEYIESKVPFKIIEPTNDTYKDIMDLWLVFKRDDENELHYVIDNYWYFTSSDIWLERIIRPSTKHISVVEKIFQKLNIVLDPLERPLNVTQKILLKHKFGEDIGDHIVKMDKKKIYLYDIPYICHAYKKNTVIKYLTFMKLSHCYLKIFKHYYVLNYMGSDDSIDESIICFVPTDKLIRHCMRKVNVKYLIELRKRNKTNFLYSFPKKDLLEIYRKYGFTFGPFKL